MSNRRSEAWVDDSLESLRLQHLLRLPRGGEDAEKAGGWAGLDFSSNDYLGLAQNPHVVAGARAALERYGAGAGASRLLAGSLPVHAEVERRLAVFKGYPACLLFGSGYLAATGAVPAVVGRDDHVFLDRLAHACLVDGAILSRARLHRFRHNDAGHLAELLRAAPAGGRRLVVTESVFSMDGDLAPLDAIADAAASAGAMLLIDEAHATGVFGPGGAGLIAERGLAERINLSMFTLGKALGGAGGAIGCAVPMRDWLWNRARSFVFTTAPPPAAAGAVLGALDVLAREPDLGARLLDRAGVFRARLRAAGFDTMNSESQIVPVAVGDNAKTLALARRLETAGVRVAAIRPPTVPAGTARLRFSVTLNHTEADLAKAADALVEAARAEGLA